MVVWATLNTPTNDIQTDKINAKALAALITELNIARRNSSAYPKGHPVIAASLSKVLSVYENLLSNNDKIILGITSDALMVGGNFLDKSNLVYRDFSHALFERGIGVLEFHNGITIGELNNFTTILGLKRDRIQKHGGIEQVWSKSGIKAMSIRPIRYDLLKTTEQDSITADPGSNGSDRLWVRFARELTLGDQLNVDSDEISLDPEILAKMFNHKYTSGSINESDVRTAISAFLDNNSDVSSSESSFQEQNDKLAAFISKLTPDLRRQFINSSFGSSNKKHQAAAGNILTKLTDNAIIETLDDISNDRLSVSPVVFGLLQRLGANAKPNQSKSEDLNEDDEISHKMKTIFREHDSEEFVPDDYQRKLNKIIASDQIPRLKMEEVTELMVTMDSRSVEAGIGHILMNLIREGIESPEERDMLLQNLSDMFGFFLQTGDYGQLHEMINQLTDGTFPIEIQYRLRDEYGRRELLDEILDGLTVWGKPRYDDIKSLIHKIGGQFVEAILDRLAEEKNMSLRRFYIDRLIEMGPVTRVPIINRLYDTRWYFLRNLLIILSSQNDPSVVAQIRPLLRSEDPRLRHEALKTMVHFRDPQAEKLVMDNLSSQNQELQTAAIQLSEQCSSPAIVAKLANILMQGGYSQSEYDKKSAIIHALGEIGRAEVLPELAKILRSRSLLHFRQLTKLKTDIINSLPKYPVKVSRPVLERIASGSGDIARLAEETLRVISGKMHE
jgi:DNA-binding transcriptional ArsR family regulator